LIKPIPKRLLPNSVFYKPYIPDTGEGATYGSTITLSNVKVEEKKQFHATRDGNEIVGNAIMFYDYVNSSGLTAEPTNQSIIIYNGKTYHIVDTDTLRGNSNLPHHYEILLK
jgi:hypothetical protein